MTTRYNFYCSEVKCYCLNGLNYDHNTCSNMISDLCSTRVNVKRPNCNLLLRCSCTAANFKALSIIALSAQRNYQSYAYLNIEVKQSWVLIVLGWADALRFQVVGFHGSAMGSKLGAFSFVKLT